MIQGIKHTYLVTKILKKNKISYVEAVDEEKKRYFIKYSSSSDEIVFLKKEASYLNYLKLEYYVELLKDDQNVYLVLNYIDGKKLNHYVFSSIVEKLNIFLRILDKVEYIHALGVIHGDLKPSNILIGEDIFIIDYNHSVLFGNGEVSNFATPAYASLEHFLHQPLEFSSDIYSLGIIFFELITGHKLFENKKTKQIINESIFGISELIRDHGDYFNCNFIFQKCIAYDKEFRYKSISELKDDIKKLILLYEKV
jgi:serine/threonine-protein kinase